MSWNQSSRWNYRVFKQQDGYGNWVFFLGEAYYKDNKFDGGYSGPETLLIGENRRDLRETLAMLNAALNHDVIELDGVYKAEWEKMDEHKDS